MFIDLSINKLDYTLIDDNAFRGLGKLRKLYLSSNRAISTVRKQWFKSLISLENLRIASSHVLTIEDNSFQELRNLSIVVLNNNRIAKIPPELFHGLPILRGVYIQQNSIQNLPVDMFLGSSEKLYELNIAYNQITNIRKEVNLQNLTQLQKLSVQNNPYSCNCNILWFRNWLLNGTSATLLDKDEVVCASGPTDVVKKNLLEFDPEILHCKSQLIMIITMACSVGLVICALVSFIYYHRWNIRYWYQRRKLRKQYERLTHLEAPPLDQRIIYDAFISYNSKDVEWVNKVLQTTLEAPPHNLKLCIDYRDFLVGEAIAQNIANSVRSSRKTVLVVSNNFVRSEWCNFELEMARNRMFDAHEDVLVTILLENVKYSSMPVLLQKVLRKKTYIEWPKEEGRKVFWTRLARAIGSPNVSLEASRIGIN
ncbi:toll-like receptor 13 isoform X2 [Anneissia japonica]|uniref:toll-like receptor 13 isoform X1 n=1 Tax=Anneissia japonica TaxID=1529436 RepID=UPI001425738A|nr:toll-like receptor 13 isoform X1 [Anneissia japonica]XP_033105824.1 toll-like receptor 13 isoform X2 [Anneissia japonica]